MADVMVFAGTGTTYKNGYGTVYAPVPTVTGVSCKTNPDIARDVFVSMSGRLDTRFDNCGVSGNYYFT
jgi:hypothetical protein